jgi:hypothetical protein
MSLASLSSLVQCLWERPGAYPRVGHLKGRLWPYPQTLCQAGGLPRTNTLAYYENPQITAVKSFIVQAPGQIGFVLVGKMVR